MVAIHREGHDQLALLPDALVLRVGSFDDLEAFVDLGVVLG